MKVNEKIFSLPPYISTSWSNVAALHMRDSFLIVNMVDGETVEIPDLKPEILEKIFEAHEKHLDLFSEQESITDPLYENPHSHQTQEAKSAFEFPLKFGIGAMETWGAALQHNPQQASMPNLPEEVLEKVRSISKIIAPDDSALTPKPEPHCNCMHCQIARAINQGLDNSDIYVKEEALPEEAVSEEELRFQQWEITQTDEKMYSVVNRLDPKEKYCVYLGKPVGCTCGKDGCEHVRAVLMS